MSTPTRPPLSRFWPALERLPGQAAVAAQWRHLVGTDFRHIGPLLDPEPQLAGSYPRFDGCAPDYTVVEHGPDDFVGVGGDDGDRTKLSRADLVVYRLNPTKLCAAVAAAFALEPDGAAVAGLSATYGVAVYRPYSGFAFPVYLTVPTELPEYSAVVAALLTADRSPFILLAPTGGQHRAASHRLLAGRDALFLALADAIRYDTPHWQLTDEARAVLGTYTTRWLPPGAAPPDFFPTPAGAKWAMVRIRFLDGHRVTVSVGALAQTLNYHQLGLVDRRNGNPNQQWELLRSFARRHGRMTWSHPDATRKNQKRKELLATALKTFFRIPGEPFRTMPDRAGWEAIFALEPDV